MTIDRVSVIGAGAWGTALANHAASLGVETTLWAYEPEVVDEINGSHRNTTYLPEVVLHAAVRATNDLADACRSPLLFFAVPSHVMETIVERMTPHLADDAVVVSLTKGIETKKLRLPLQVLRDHLQGPLAERLVSLSGPSFAREVAEGKPTAITAASYHAASATAVQELLTDNRLRVYTHDDPTGVEVGGVVKNVVAIAAGISDGLGLGYNTRAALITRGLAEMVRFGKKMGARETTFAGLSGIGDLILTATGDLSRNRTVGIQLGKGKTVDEITGGMKSVAEGVRTSRSVYELARTLEVDMPLCSEVYRVCHEGKEPKAAVGDLMGRAPKDEFYG